MTDPMTGGAGPAARARLGGTPGQRLLRRRMSAKRKQSATLRLLRARIWS
jgi:hypothetical protein